MILPEDFPVPGADDSKKLSRAKREALYDEITRNAVAYCVSFADVGEIERLNIRGATFLAMRRAVEGLHPAPGYAVIDGDAVPPGLRVPAEAVVRGDGSELSVAAASILAKVSRDRVMRELAARYPGYGFERNSGYGTPEHIAALKRLGPTPVHRKLFLRKIL